MRKSVMPGPLDPFVEIARRAVAGQLTLEGFEAEFLALFKEADGLSDDEFGILNQLFHVVEDYVPDAADRDPGDATAEQLLDAVREFLHRIEGGRP
ncbi:hypothetical protein KBZ10_08750 [Streptomyces sp. F63]|uniref:colicin immunity domain-containing protein n=1 Tax=Streptomyces sp. F63 TaxID=2824887 RepID=UPI001B37C952|nr:colicin immunity domain-containing protein [Streptomyces sp. F63]MBQ0984604.1 hypothetical protein [Streptomyces sp. F63]